MDDDIHSEQRVDKSSGHSVALQSAEELIRGLGRLHRRRRHRLLALRPHIAVAEG